MRGALLTVLALAGCFDPQLGDRPFRCGAGKLCPPGYRCDGRNECVRSGIAADADASPPDGPIADIDARVADARPAADASAADARPADARPADATVADGRPECLPSCGPATCSQVSCGRSPCGYPCNACPVSAIGDPCIDHYGQMLDEGDRGLRTCIAEPKRMESCVCTGGGAAAWTNCAGGCVDEGCSRVRQIGCGFRSCGPGEVCCRRGRDSGCTTTGSCGNFPAASCDGPEDCTIGPCCSVDVPESAQCVVASTCGAQLTHCHSTADCPLNMPLCCATGPTTGSKACFATPQAGGCN